VGFAVLTAGRPPRCGHSLVSMASAAIHHAAGLDPDERAPVSVLRG
jgi:hypothetical protein